MSIVANMTHSGKGDQYGLTDLLLIVTYAYDDTAVTVMHALIHAK